MSDIFVPHSRHGFIQILGRADRDFFLFAAATANDVVMVRLRIVELVTSGPVAELATLHELVFLQNFNRAVNRHKVASDLGLELLARKRTVFLDKGFQDGSPRRRDSQAQSL